MVMEAPLKNLDLIQLPAIWFLVCFPCGPSRPDTYPKSPAVLFRWLFKVALEGDKQKLTIKMNV